MKSSVHFLVIVTSLMGALLLMLPRDASAASFSGGSGAAPFQPIKAVLEVSSTNTASGGWTFKIVVRMNNDVPLPAHPPEDCNPGNPGLGSDGLPITAGREYDVIVSDYLTADDNPSKFQVVNFGFMPCGHPPVGVFTVPHYDIHFFYTDQQQRAEMTCLAAEQRSTAGLCFDSLDATEFFSFPDNDENIIAGFSPDALPIGVKGQGYHWYKQPVFGPWQESTVVQTTYDGRITSFEVMVPLHLPAGSESGITFQRPTVEHNPSAYTYSREKKPDGDIVTLTVSKES